MQTFLPYPDFVKSLKCLDSKRLGKQRVEALQILNTLTGKSNGWKNHPAVRMWADYKIELMTYHDMAIEEWIKRGFNNTMKLYLGEFPRCILLKEIHWLTEEFCAAHRSNLLRKDPVYYGKFGWTEPNDLSYVWPV